MPPIPVPFAAFADLPPPLCMALWHGAPHRHWRSGETVFLRGDAEDGLIALLSGRVRVSLPAASGRELVLHHLGPGDILGEISVLDGAPRAADAQAVAPTEGVVIDRSRLIGLAQRHPELGLALARHLCGMLRRTNFQMESIALYDLRLRLVRFLLFAIGARGAAGGMVALRLDLTQGDLSSILGASRQKVNAALQALIAEGAVQRHGPALICDSARLEAIAGGG